MPDADPTSRRLPAAKQPTAVPLASIRAYRETGRNHSQASSIPRERAEPESRVRIRDGTDCRRATKSVVAPNTFLHAADARVNSSLIALWLEALALWFTLWGEIGGGPSACVGR